MNSSSSDNARMGGGKRGLERKNPSSEPTPKKVKVLAGGGKKGGKKGVAGWDSDSSDDDDYGVNQRAVQKMRGECDGRPEADCVCGDCIMIDKFRLKLHFSNHRYDLKKKDDYIRNLEEEIVKMKNDRINELEEELKKLKEE